MKGNSTSLDSHNESPRCSPSYKRSLSLGLSSIGPYSSQGSSSPIATLELEPLDDPSPHPYCLAELVVNFSLRCAKGEPPPYYNFTRVPPNPLFLHQNVSFNREGSRAPFSGHIKASNCTNCGGHKHKYKNQVKWAPCFLMINYNLTKTHISSETWTSFGKIYLPKKSSFLLQSRHYLTTQSRIGQSIRFVEVEKNPNSRIAFQNFLSLFGLLC